ncbi:MAG: hypothetical protein ABGW92_00385 [Methanocaldococcus sp.]
MKGVVLTTLIFFVLFFLSLCFGEMYEYRGVVFYPNGSQTIEVSKLYVDYPNPNTFGIYVFYRNTSHYLPYPKNITLTLPPQKFNISIFISSDRISQNEWMVYYKIVNNYPYDINFNITLPNGFNIKNTSILVPANSYKTIILSKKLNSNTLYFGDSNVSFEIPAIVKIRYSLSIPFSIMKSNKILDNNSIEWTATYVIKNNKNISLNVNVSYWAIVNDNRINFGNYSYILNPNENITQSFNLISDDVPIFYLKFYAWRDIYKTIKVKPALKVNNSYIIGMGKVKGKSFSISFIKSPVHHKKKPTKKKTQYKNTENEVSPNIAETHNPKKVKTTQTHGTTQSKKKEEVSSENKNEERRYPLIIRQIFKEKVKNPVVAVSAAITTTSTSLILMLLPPLFLRRHPDISDKGVFTIEELEMLNSWVYVPEGCKLGKILPSGITIVKLSDSEKALARELHEVYDIPLNSAKAIILGVKYGGRVFLSDERAYRLAIRIGLEAYIF